MKAKLTPPSEPDAVVCNPGENYRARAYLIGEIDIESNIFCGSVISVQQDIPFQTQIKLRPLKWKREKIQQLNRA